jgi:hypothetical protein
MKKKERGQNVVFLGKGKEWAEMLLKRARSCGRFNPTAFFLDT